MEFKGHTLYKIDNNWVFDLTTFIGYKVDLNDSGDVKRYQKAFIAVFKKENYSYTFDKIIHVPIRVLRRVINVIQAYRREALLENASG